MKNVLVFIALAAFAAVLFFIPEDSDRSLALTVHITLVVIFLLAVAGHKVKAVLINVLFYLLTPVFFLVYLFWQIKDSIRSYSRKTKLTIQEEKELNESLGLRA